METKTQAARPQYKRRIIVIKRALQMKFVMLVFLAVLFTVAVVSVDVYFVVGKMLVKEFGDANLLPIVKGASKLLLLHFTFYSLTVVIVSVFVSHKLAGPIFRLEQTAESIAGGDLRVKIYLRQGDELFETAEYINRMIESLREKVLRDKNLSARISGKLEGLTDNLKNGKITNQAASAQLNDILIEVRHIASDFKV